MKNIHIIHDSSNAVVSVKIGDEELKRIDRTRPVYMAIADQLDGVGVDELPSGISLYFEEADSGEPYEISRDADGIVRAHIIFEDSPVFWEHVIGHHHYMRAFKTVLESMSKAGIRIDEFHDAPGDESFIVRYSICLTEEEFEVALRSAERKMDAVWEKMGKISRSIETAFTSTLAAITQISSQQ